MKHKSYNATQRKLRKLWNLLTYQNSLVPNSVAEEIILRNKELNDSLITLYESDFSAIPLPSPQFPLTIGSRTTTKETEVGVRFNYQVQIPSIEIPEFLLPFVSYKVIFKAIPETQILPLHLWNFTRATITERITVSGTEIFNGVAKDERHVYQQEDIDNDVILESATKKVWYAFQTSEFFQGYVDRITATYDKVAGTGDCAGFTNRKVVTIDYGLPKHNIQQMSITGFAGIGNLKEYKYTSDGNGGCNLAIIDLVVDNTVALNWAQGDPALIFVSDVSTGIISGSIVGAPTTVIESGFWLYFNQDSHPPRVGFENVGGDNTLENLPSLNGFDEVDIGKIIVTPTVSDTEDSVAEPVNGEEFLIFDRNEVGEQPGTKKYFIHIGGEAIAMTNITDLDSNILGNVKTNTFTWNGGTDEYDEALTGDFTQPQYKFPTQDIEFKVVLMLKNPFYYRDQVNFNV